MSNTTFSIVMPDQLRAFVDQRLETGAFGNVSEYFRHLVREDRKRAAEEKLEALLLEGEHSGEPIAADAAWLARKKANLRARRPRPKKS